MKIDKKVLLVITFVGALLVFLLAFFLITRFSSGFKDIITAIYFAIWVTAAMGMWLFIIQPYLQGRKKTKSEEKKAGTIQKPGPVPSPRSNLPLRDRIREYVTERRKEEGLPVPEPLLPSRSAGPKTTKSKDKPSVFATGAAVATGTVVAAAAASGDGDLPLPDDFDDSGSSDLFGDEYPDEGGGEASLPGIDDEDLGSFGGEGEETSLPGIGDEDFGSFDDTGVDESSETDSGDLPGFEGDLESDMSESGLADSMDNFSDEESPTLDLMPEDDGGLSDDGLDLDMPLDDDMMDDDMSGDSDFSEIEFEDIEPDEN